MPKFGLMGAEPGEKCSNRDERFTCPGCYHDHLSEVSECEHCGAPLKCYEEEVTEYYCEIDYREVGPSEGEPMDGPEEG